MTLSLVPTHVDLEKLDSGGLWLAQDPECTVSISCTCYGLSSKALEHSWSRAWYWRGVCALNQLCQHRPGRISLCG